MYASYVVFLLLVATAIKCNGLEDLCDLRINQATFPGSHNAGSGFDGLLYYWSGGPVTSCFYRNQGKSFSEQLAFGIRYFDIDSCYGKNEALNCHCPGGGKDCAYAGSIEKGLLQIDGWMKSNPNEVVIIHFNRDSQEGYRGKIAKSIEAVLLKLWPPNNAHELAMNTYRHHNNNKWPTLKEAVTSNQRIFLFMDNGLAQHLQAVDWLVISKFLIASTWDTIKFTSNCSAITRNAGKKCGSNRDFIDLSAFGSYGKCTWDMARICSKWLGEAQEACYQKRKVNGKTVNFLLVDWIDYYDGESVVKKALIMNQKNIKKYLG